MQLLDQSRQAEFIQAISQPNRLPEFIVFNQTKVWPTWHISNRQINEHLVYLVSDESISFTSHESDTQLNAHPGTLIWLSPNTKHTFQNVDRAFPATLYHLRFILPNDHLTIFTHGAFTSINADRLFPRFKQLLSDYQSESTFRDERMAASLIHLFTAIFHLIEQETESSGMLSPAQREKLLIHISEKQQYWISPKELAESLDLTHDYFSRIFKRTYGMTPSHWILTKRIQAGASKLIESERSITQIALDLGYMDIYLFSRQFKAVLGMSPSQYRQNAF